MVWREFPRAVVASCEFKQVARRIVVVEASHDAYAGLGVVAGVAKRAQRVEVEQVQRVGKRV